MARIEPTPELMKELEGVLQSSEVAQVTVGLSEIYLMMQACQLVLTMPAERMGQFLREAYEAIGRRYQGAMEGKVSREFMEFCEQGWHREFDEESE